jgi:hypothetical protein
MGGIVMLLSALHEFRHEVVSSVLVAVFIGMVTMPFKKVMKAYNEAKAKLDSISTELAVQRTNHLAHIQESNDTQVVLLTKAVDALQNIQLDNREILTRQRAPNGRSKRS